MEGIMKYIIWHDNDYDFALWVYKNTNLVSKEVELRSIPKSNTKKQMIDSFADKLTRMIMPVIKYETPDIIIQQISPENKIICVTEFMTHTPQFQHPAQRFTRLYNCAVLKIPAAIVLPERKTKLEKGKKEVYEEVSYVCSPSVYNFFYQTSIKSHSPLLLFEWPHDHGYLRYDSYHPTSPYVSDQIVDWINFVNLCLSTNGVIDFMQPELSVIRTRLETKKSVTSIDQFTTIKGIYTKTKIQQLYPKLDKTHINNLKNPTSLVFCPSGLKCASSPFRTDPYAGMLCVFDVLFCRDGSFNRDVNLILDASDVSTTSIDFKEIQHISSECPFVNPTINLNSDHYDDCPFIQAKYRRIYGEVSDIVIFKDKYFVGGKYYEFV